jgi:diguanylate cyclase (GGDEF)-like protein
LVQVPAKGPIERPEPYLARRDPGWPGRLIAWLPKGRQLPEQTWSRRHVLIVRFALLQSLGVAVFGLLRGYPAAVCAVYGTLVAVPAVLALYKTAGRRIRTISSTVSLMFASATIVDLAGGSDVAHFHFFVMVGVVALYQDWTAFGVCILITVLHHAVLGLIDPSDVYGSQAERNQPIVWALIHGAFVLAASVTHLIAWRANENTELLDPLTQMANRTAFVENLERALRDTDTPVSVCFLDVDNFKQINDSAGHHVGDRALVHAARQMQYAVREGDLVARLGGDEFAMFVRGTAAEAENVAVRLLTLFEAPFSVGDHEIRVSVSIGVADSDLAGSRRAEDLLRDADLAMYLAKSSGKNRVFTYTVGVDRIVRERAELASDLRRALGNNELAVYYQPVVAGDGGRLVGVEALLRWNHPVKGLVAPGEFIALAEETGEIRQIGAWVLRTAAAQVVAWQHMLPGCQDLQLAVNLSPIQLRDDDLLSLITDTLIATSLRADHLTLEVTESMLLADLVRARKQLASLRSLGVSVAIDDFGTGYSSLSYLSELPADVIKIDRSFVRELETGSGPSVLVQAVVDMAKALKLGIVAEGVERKEQQELLTQLGCPQSQGFLYSPALPSAEFADLARSWHERDGRAFVPTLASGRSDSK